MLQSAQLCASLTADRFFKKNGLSAYVGYVEHIYAQMYATYPLETFVSLYEEYSPSTLQEYDKEVYEKIAEIRNIVTASASSFTLRRSSVSHRGRGDGYRGKGSVSRGYGKGGGSRVRQRPQLVCKAEKDERIQELNIALNKITEKTYDKLWSQILEILENEEAYVDHVLERIFVLVSLNKSLLSVYTKMYGYMQKKYSGKCEALFSLKIEEYAESVNEIVPLNPQTDYDEYCSQCKRNDQRRSISHFFCELNRINAISTENFYMLIERMYTLFIECVMGENKGERVNEAVENLQILTMSAEGDIQSRMPLIWEIAKSENARSEYPSITNKSIFKCRDIAEMVK